ncbi:MAG: hypothetical protein ACSLFN_15435 [Candidatus Limnocylindrales bacterium]
MKVLIIPEDPTYDQYILKPVVSRAVEEAGLTGRIEVLTDPHLRGSSDALDPAVISSVIDENPMIDLFVLCVDRDCNRDGNTAKAAAIEATHTGRLIACVAKEEIEVWMLAIHRPIAGSRWSDIAAECDAKERFGDPFLRSQGWHDQVGGGRKRAMRDLGASFAQLLGVCGEVSDLRSALVAWRTTQT